MTRQHILLAAILACTSIFSFIYAVRERSDARAMEYSRNQVMAELSSARTEMQKLSSRVNDLTLAATREPAPSPPVPAPERPSPMGTRRATVQRTGRPRTADDPRWRRVESRLTEHQLQLAAQRERIAQTQEDVRRTGDQLDGKINSTRDELNGSLGKTRDDVALLQKRGERSVYEFDLAKSKQFERVGPLSLSLRKADPKHGRYDLSFMVNDKPVAKQNLNVSEPVWITLADLPQPLQVVVSEVDKNRIRGYVSAPRYKNGELAGGPTTGVSQIPALKQR